MRSGGWHTVRHYLLLLCRGVFGTTLCTVGPLSQVQPATFPALKPAIVWATNHTWWLLPVGFLLTFTEFSLQIWGSPSKWEAVHAFLDGLQEHVFSDGTSTPLHEKRVTLFEKRRCCCWLKPARSTFWMWGRGRHPWSGWLMPAVRSGHTTQKSGTVFLCPDDAVNAEGVAGRAWECNGDIVRHAPHNLELLWKNKVKARRNFIEFRGPNLPGFDAEKRELQDRLHRAERDLKVAVRDYAELTSVSEQWVMCRLHSNKLCSRWFYAVPVEVNGKPWGVIVIEAATPPFTDKDSLIAFKERLTFFKKLLGSVLESL